MNDLSCIVFYAFRYALGRMTYAVHDVATFIMLNTHLLETKDMELMIEEITEAHEQDRLGMSCDVETWLNLQECLINTLKQRKEEG